MNWFRKILLREQKRRALLEVGCDLNFIERYRHAWLNYDESEGRKILRSENIKDEGRRDQAKIKDVSRKIAKHLATKKEYQDLQGLEKDLMAYIEMI